MTGVLRVPVKTGLPGAEFRYLDALARHHGIDVGELVAEIVHRRLDGVDLDARPPRQVIKAKRPQGQQDPFTVLPRRMSDAERVRARELYDEGLNGREIAEELGFTEQTISRWRIAAGLPVQGLGVNGHAKWTDEHDAKLREMHARGLSDTDIAGVVGFSQGTVSRRRKMLGLAVLYRGGHRVAS